MSSVRIRAQVPSTVQVDTRDLDGRAVVWADLDAVTRHGALSSASSLQIEAAATIARKERMPLVAVVRSSGADIAEGMAALHGWGLAAKAIADCSGVVPVVMIVDGPAVSGPALLLGLADFVVMTEESYAFVSGPTMVAEFTGVAIGHDELGGSASHARYSGTATLVAPDLDTAVEMTAQLLAYLPSHNDEEAPLWPTDDPIDRGDMLELRARWATNAVTAFATIGGMPVGIVANQPIALAGTLDIPASQKAARFVACCDAFNLPIVTLVDTPGFYPGKDLEWRGMIRHGAQLVFAYARATVPRICVILRKSYGGAYIVMDSKTMGNDLCLAWPWAELAVMGAGQAAAILQRRATPAERAAFEADYTERLLNPYIAADRGLVDAVIEPAETRSVIGHALAALIDKREHLQARTHDNTPL